MVPSPFPSANPFSWIRWTGFLRSSHALLALCVLLCLLFAVLVPVLIYPAFALFAVQALTILGRYVFRGPEAERLQPVVSVSSYETRVLNVDPNLMARPEFGNFLQQMNRMRQPLPAPTGVVRGPVTDPASIREITDEEAERLRAEDNAEISEAT